MHVTEYFSQLRMAFFVFLWQCEFEHLWHCRGCGRQTPVFYGDCADTERWYYYGCEGSSTEVDLEINTNEIKWVLFSCLITRIKNKL
jgi:hypothetical protein